MVAPAASAYAHIAPNCVNTRRSMLTGRRRTLLNHALQQECAQYKQPGCVASHCCTHFAAHACEALTTRAVASWHISTIHSLCCRHYTLATIVTTRWTLPIAAEDADISQSTPDAGCQKLRWSYFVSPIELTVAASCHQFWCVLSAAPASPAPVAAAVSQKLPR